MYKIKVWKSLPFYKYFLNPRKKKNLTFSNIIQIKVIFFLKIWFHENKNEFLKYHYAK